MRGRDFVVKPCDLDSLFWEVSAPAEGEGRKGGKERGEAEGKVVMEKAQATTSTTFVQADAHTFRDLVQKLTGANEDCPDKLPITVPARVASRDVGGPRRSGFKLQERRQNMRKLEIKLGLTSLRNSGFSPRSPSHPQIAVSPITSPVTPLGSESLFSSNYPLSGSESPSPVVSEEEKTIAEKGFYLSPLSTPRGSDPPELLPLFPLRSPKQSQAAEDL